MKMIPIKLSSKLILSAVLATALTSNIDAATKSNVALDAASLSASTELTDYPVSKINDRVYSTQTQFWSGYHGKDFYGQYEYVELNWDSKEYISQAVVFWANSGDSIQTPTDAYLAYWDGTDWVKSTTLSAADANSKSTTDTEIRTRKIRLYMKGDKACGIRELRLFGYSFIDPTEKYSWTKYSPTLDYNYKYEYPNGFPAPTKMLPENNNAKGYKADGWWAIAWGPKASHYVTETAKTNILKKMNEDFAFFRDTMGWPPDKRARNGYYSTIYLYGSGLYSDAADSTARGGWQSATYYAGSNWPMVSLSYYPVACYDPTFTSDKYYSEGVSAATRTDQQNACVHEGIHAIFADLEGCKESAWYQEAGNTWLQGEAGIVKTGTIPSSMGWLSAGNMIAPFMPIECYSGWLLDGSFGGPSAEGVNMYNSNGQQVCTWRKLLGGVQYGELFPHFLSEILGRNSIAWIWRYCKGRVLEGMADSLGEKQMRHLIVEYRSRQALVDVGNWSTACYKLLDDNWLASLKEEWSPYSKSVTPWIATPYANMYKCNEVDSAGWWYPENRTTPGWSGANQIPLHVNGAVGNIIRVNFKPLGNNMVCQLCYRTKRGRCYYSYPLEGEGEVALELKELPANNVVIAVVCNTDYIYKNDQTRKTHYDYRLQMGENVYMPASSKIKWYNYNEKLTDAAFAAGIEQVEVPVESAKFKLEVEKTTVQRGEALPIHIGAASQYEVPVFLYNAQGQSVYEQGFTRDGDFNVPADIKGGMYILTARNGKESASVKIIVK